MPVIRAWAVWVASAGLAYASLMNVCHLLFQCGCRSWWTGAASHCNIHQAGARHCPWCALDPQVFWGLFAGFVAAQGVALWFTRRQHLAWQMFAALASYLAAATLSAVVLGFFTDYWN